MYMNDAALVSFESISNDHKAQAQNAGVNTYTWEEFLNLVSQ